MRVIRSRSLSLVLVLLASASGALRAQDARDADSTLSLTNRERTLRFTLDVGSESPRYRVDRLTPDGAANVVVDWSPLGITRMGEDFTSGLEFVGASPVSELSSTYHMVSGKQLDVLCCIVFELENSRIVIGREHFYDLYVWDMFWS